MSKFVCWLFYNFLQLTFNICQIIFLICNFFYVVYFFVSSYAIGSEAWDIYRSGGTRSFSQPNSSDRRPLPSFGTYEWGNNNKCHSYDESQLFVLTIIIVMMVIIILIPDQVRKKAIFSRSRSRNDAGETAGYLCFVHTPIRVTLVCKRSQMVDASRTIISKQVTCYNFNTNKQFIPLITYVLCITLLKFI